MSGDVVYHAKCLCGDVAFDVVTEPKWVGHCHCPSCQKATSASYATYAGFQKEAVALKGTAPKVYKSSPGVVRRFCGKCGSPVSFEGETWPGEVHLHVALFSDAANFKPHGHTYVRTKMPWVHIEEGEEQYDTFPDKGA